MAKIRKMTPTPRPSYEGPQGPHPILGVFFWAVSIAGLAYGLGSVSQSSPGGVVLGLGIFLFAGLLGLADRTKRRRFGDQQVHRGDRLRRRNAAPVRGLFTLFALAALVVAALAAVDANAAGFWIAVASAIIFASLAAGIGSETRRAPMPQVLEEGPDDDDVIFPPPHVITEQHDRQNGGRPQ